MSSVFWFTSAARRAISRTPSSAKTRFTPSVFINATYCFSRALSGSVKIRKNSSFPRAFSSTRMGKRPWSSGTRSEGLQRWKAPLAMNRMWSVLTIPYFVVTVAPSTIGSKSRCTPSRDTSGPCPPPWRETILSISSRKMMPDCSVLITALRVTLSISIRSSTASFFNILKASATVSLRILPFLGNILPKASRRFDSISSIPALEKTSIMGIGCACVTSISTSFSSSRPSRNIFLKRSRVDSLFSAVSEPGVSTFPGISILELLLEEGIEGRSRSSSLSSAISRAFCSTSLRSSFLTILTASSMRSRIIDSTSRPT